jgi:hypothetical protein
MNYEVVFGRVEGGEGGSLSSYNACVVIPVLFEIRDKQAVHVSFTLPFILL